MKNWLGNKMDVSETVTHWPPSEQGRGKSSVYPTKAFIQHASKSYNVCTAADNSDTKGQEDNRKGQAHTLFERHTWHIVTRVPQGQNTHFTVLHASSAVHTEDTSFYSH